VSAAGEPSGLDAVFGALADPTRRQIVQRLLQDGPVSATDLAVGFPMTRQAVVKHLQVLADAGLVDGRRHGREVRFAPSADGLSDAQRWIARTGAAWDRRLGRLRDRLERRS
jgi:DNA-binding transcriptional ArsR family regulator